MAAFSDDANQCTKNDGMKETITCQKQKFGFIDKNAQIVIKPQFDEVGSFFHGVALVSIGEDSNKQWGLIDKTGKILLKPQFFRIDFMHNMIFKKGVYTSDFSTAEVTNKVHRGKKMEFLKGLMDMSNGQILIEPKYLDLGKLEEGLISASEGIYSKNDDLLMSKTGYLDRQGNIAIPFQFQRGEIFQNGKARVTYMLPQTADPKNETWIDKTGKLFIIPAPNDQLERLKEPTPMRQSTFDKIREEHLLDKLKSEN